MGIHSKRNSQCIEVKPFENYCISSAAIFRFPVRIERNLRRNKEEYDWPISATVRRCPVIPQSFSDSIATPLFALSRPRTILDSPFDLPISRRNGRINKVFVAPTLWYHVYTNYILSSFRGDGSRGCYVFLCVKFFGNTREDRGLLMANNWPFEDRIETIIGNSIGFYIEIYSPIPSSTLCPKTG